MYRDLLFRIKDIFLKTGKKWDRLAPSENDAITFASEYLNFEPLIKLDDGEYSFEYRLAASGESINERCRNDSWLEVDKIISETVSKYAIKKDIVVYRGVVEEVFSKMIESARTYADTDLLEKGFLATSLVKGHELQYKYKLRIFLPAGTHAVYQGNINAEETKYYEVDVQHNARLKIVSIDKEYINCKLIKTA